MPLAMASSGRRMFTSVSFEENAAAVSREVAEDNLSQFSPARSHQARKADHLAGVDMKAHAAMPVAVQIFHAQHFPRVVAGRAR